ncbi:MAG: hypothetical protein R3B13_30570 [Polyangiaceae bacterium]
MRLDSITFATLMLIGSTAAAQPMPGQASPASSQPGAPASGSYDVALQNAPPPMDTQDDEEESWNVGVKAGVLTAGSVYVEVADRSFDTSAGLLLLANVDAMVGKRLSMGAFVLNAHPSVTVLGTDYDATITTLGGTIKGRFGPSGGVSIRPGIAFGYQLISGDGPATDDVKGFDIGAVLEIAIPVGGLRVPLEVGFISQPAGGNDATDLTFAPIPYLAGGVEFGG